MRRRSACEDQGRSRLAASTGRSSGGGEKALLLSNAFIPRSLVDAEALFEQLTAQLRQLLQLIPDHKLHPRTKAVDFGPIQ
jgi:hypothetical protein